MSRLLYRLGMAGFRRPWIAIGAWTLLLVALGTLIGVNGVHFTSNMTIDGTQSQQVLDTLQKEVPSATGGQGTFVITSEDGTSVTQPDRVATIMKIVDAVSATPHVTGSLQEQQQPFIDQQQALLQQAAALPEADRAAFVAQAQAQAAAQLQQQITSHGYGPLIVDGLPVPTVLVSQDDTAALFQFQLDAQVTSLSSEDIDQIIHAAQAYDGQTGLRVLPGEALTFPKFEPGLGELIGIVVAVLTLILALGSLLAGMLPLATGIVAVATGVGVAIAASSGAPLLIITPVLAVMLGLAVGIDYSLFIVNRQRNLIRSQGLSAPDAAGRAIGTAGSSVVFAGLTVVIALVALTAVGVSMLTTMAIIAAATVAIAVLAALTLLPSLLGLVGERVVTSRARRATSTQQEQHRIARGWSGFVVRQRWVVLVASAVLIVLAGLPMTRMVLGMPTGGNEGPGTSSRMSYDTVSSSFGVGFNGPLVAVAEAGDGDPFDQSRIDALTNRISQVDGVRIAQEIGQSHDDRTVAFMVVPSTGPGDQRTTTLVHALRDVTVEATGNGRTLGVTGLTAVMIDMGEKMSAVFPLYIAIIVVLSMIILLLAFRSLLLPLLATAGFVLSIFATLGETTLVFQDGWAGGLFGVEPGTPIVPMIPIMATGILYGLAMDYQVFLSSTIRDRYLRGGDPRKAVVEGFSLSSRVVVAAAIIMTSVFAGFIFSDETMIAQVGFTLAAGVLIDAFLVRMTLIPAAFAVLGRAAWWVPRWLDRLLPDLDIEGHQLERSLERTSQAGYPQALPTN